MLVRESIKMKLSKKQIREAQQKAKEVKLLNHMRLLDRIVAVVEHKDISSEAKIMFSKLLIHAEGVKEFTIRNNQIKAVMPHLSSADISSIWKELVNAGFIEKTFAGLDGNLIKVLV